MSTVLMQDNIPSTAAIGLFVSLPSYWIFRRYEPSSSLTILSLLIGAPALAATRLGYIAGCQNLSYLHSAISLTSMHMALLLILVTLYRLSPFHPLSAYPGPTRNKLSKLHSAWMVSTGRQHLYYRSLHDKFGDVVRVGPNELSIRHAGAVPSILGHSGLPKGPFWDHRAGSEEGSHPPLIAVRNPQEHARRRKPWNRALSRAAITAYETSIVRSTESLMTALRIHVGEPLNITEWMGFFALDNMGSIVFGQSYGILKNGVDEKGIQDIIEGGTRFAAITGQIPWVIPSLRAVAGSRHAYERMKQYARASALERLSDTMRARDLFHYLNDEEGREHAKRPISLVASDASLAMVAGSDTPAATLAAMWYYLLSNDVAYRRLQQEVNSDFVNPTHLPSMASMPYLNACINESLRLLPALLSGSQRSVLPGTGGKMIGPFFVPEGTQVFVHTYSLHRDPRYFSPIPDAFWPDRWLPEADRIYPPSISKADIFILDTSAFIPFSFGPTSCVGKTLALTILRAVVCSMLREFEILPYGGFEDWEATVRDHFTPKCGPLWVTLKNRKIED